MKNKLLYHLPLLFVMIFGTVNGQKKTPINVASFNLRFETVHDGENTWSNRRDFVKELITYHEFDIMGTQELHHSQISDLLQMKGWKYTGGGRDDGINKGEHSAIFYKEDRFKLLESGDFWLSETPDIPSKGWDATCCNRICSWGKFKDKKSRKTFFVFNVHFDHEGLQARIESGYLMTRKIEEIAERYPALLCGDFNSNPDTEQIQHISSQLNDSYLISELPPYGPVGTFNGFKINAPLKDRIDYIFVSNHFKIHKYGALTDFKEGRFPSDHLPVVVNLSFK
ncbi:MAG TPA: endonuclease/exonuclease/phosphatase family protein [Marinilabiliaceae bacterium]|nr:endonuclease/exonuclease/phosphatase family protein [Marinilabiliaceae bacterium]